MEPKSETQRSETLDLYAREYRPTDQTLYSLIKSRLIYRSIFFIHGT